MLGVWAAPVAPETPQQVDCPSLFARCPGPPGTPKPQKSPILGRHKNHVKRTYYRAGAQHVL